LALLEVRDLHVFYGNIEALKGISLDAEPGQIMAILGGNGAGKSTTLRTISGLLRPRSGTISFEGRSIVGLEAHVIVGMGLSQVPEGRRIFNILTVEENLNLGGYIANTSNGNYYLTGRAQDVAVYNTALSSTDVTNSYTAALNGVAPAATPPTSRCFSAWGMPSRSYVDSPYAARIRAPPSSPRKLKCHASAPSFPSRR